MLDYKQIYDEMKLFASLSVGRNLLDLGQTSEIGLESASIGWELLNPQNVNLYENEYSIPNLGKN